MNTLHKIKIQFLDEDDQVLVQGEAKDVWNAEGELQILSRAFLKMSEEEGDRLSNDNEASLEPITKSL